MASWLRPLMYYPTSFFGRLRCNKYQDVVAMDDNHYHWHLCNKRQFCPRLDGSSKPQRIVSLVST
jgi:hypothetical protein